MNNNGHFQTLGLYPKYKYNEERGNEVWAFKYNNKEVRMYKTVDMEAEEDVWYIDFTDFTEAAGLKGVFPINLYNRIPIRFKSIQLCGNSDEHNSYPHNYDQREAVNTKGYEYIFDENTNGIEEMDMIRDFMQEIHVIPKKEAPTVVEMTCEIDEKDYEQWKKLFSLDKVSFPTVMEMLVKEYKPGKKNLNNKDFNEILEEINKKKDKKDKKGNCKHKDKCKSRMCDMRVEAKPEDNFGITITFTKKELRALYLYMTKGLCPFLGDRNQIQNALAGASAKIHEAYQGMPT